MGDSEKKRKFEEIHQKVHIEHGKDLHKAQNNPQAIKLEKDIKELLENLVSRNCFKFYEKLNSLSKDEVKINEAVEYEPKEGKEKEAKTTERDLTRCLKRHYGLSEKHEGKIGSLVFFRDYSLKECLQVCSDKVNKIRDADVTECVKGCYKMAKTNTRVINNQMNDELLKLYAELKKL